MTTVRALVDDLLLHPILLFGVCERIILILNSSLIPVTDASLQV